MDDVSEIRKTLGAYCQYLDDRRYEEWANLFTEDGVIETRRIGTDFRKASEGRAAILENILSAELASRPELRRKHLFPNAIIDVDGDQATAKSDAVIFDQYGDDPYIVRMGYCSATFQKQDSKWLFTRRELSIQPSHGF